MSYNKLDLFFIMNINMNIAVRNTLYNKSISLNCLKIKYQLSLV